MKNAATCSTDHQLRDLVDERLDAATEAAVTAHVDSCAQCQGRLEDIVGHRSEWQHLRDQFGVGRATREWPSQGVRRVADALPASLGAAEGVEPEGDRDMRALQQYLSPTDDPTKLGRLGHYEVIGFVGKGSTGVVLKAHEPRLGRFVAIKVLSPSFSSNGPARARFQREARAIAAVSHEHVVPVYAVDEHEGLPFIVMQYASGGSLDQRIQRDGPLDACETLRVGIQIARGLAEAHSQGIVHRDVKPANVMLEGGVERVMVTDFGLARVADEAAMTRSGVVAGTPQYMSPEQARGEPVDPRSDLFSLGSVLYTACTGRSPFRAESVFGVIKRVCDEEPRPIRELRPEVAPWLEDFVAKLMEKRLDDRFGSATEVADLLSAELAHAQAPTILPVPERAWQAADPVVEERAVGAGRWLRAGLLGAAAMAAAAAGLFLWLGGGADEDGGAAEGASRAGLASLWSSTGSSEQAPADDSGKTVSDASAPSLRRQDEERDQDAALPIFPISSQRDLMLKAGGEVVINADFEVVHLHRVGVGEKVRALVNRLVGAEDSSRAKELAGTHSVFIEKDSANKLELVCKNDDAGAKKKLPAELRAVTLEVWIPEGCNLKVNVRTGRVIIDEVGAANVSLKTITGDLKVDMDGAAAEPWTIETTSGSIALALPASVPTWVVAKTEAGRIRGPESDVAVTGSWEWNRGQATTPIYLSSTTGLIEVRHSQTEATPQEAPAEIEEAPEAPEVPEASDPSEAAEAPEQPETPEPAEESEAPAPAKPGECEPGDDPTCGGAAEACESDCDEPKEECSEKPRSIFSEAPAPGRFSVHEGDFPGEVVDGYALYLPLSYGSGEASYPMILSLAGGCYVGGDIECLVQGGMLRDIKHRLYSGPDLESEYDRLILDSFIVVAPHMTCGSFDERQYFNEEEAIATILDGVSREFRVDENRVYVTGGGRGGHGTWGLASRMPGRFAAAVPLRGQRVGITDYAALSDMPIWASHLFGDSEVAFEHTKKAVERIESESGEPFQRLGSLRPEGDGYLDERHLLTAYEGCGLANLYASSHVFKWMLGQRRRAPRMPQHPLEDVAGGVEVRETAPLIGRQK
ncbi:MAG: protein kinase, partial [Planctomycetota bacterium]